MKQSIDQLLEEKAYPHLAAFLRSGGTLEVGENRSIGTFAQIRKGNQTITVNAAYRDFAAVLKEMDAKAKDYLNKVYENIGDRKVV